jgi:long-chain acyl-CoA synthetase
VRIDDRRRLGDMSLNLATMLRESALAHPEKPVALYDGGRLSYAELDALTDRFAVGLRASGVGPVEIRAELPKGPTGKILKKELGSHLP